ncbi:NIPSNAP family protein [Aestuariispira insulae]|uniref:NIPSNAP protein n=1 Tax=Aestuariispira insulae TaxID=1461337 RepID=A0A3D9HUS4_9PROT|nr:NIPSNAP family protein [Aestuariispira insulae]RED53238.1 NIPSNAP protein [Aestuariispira insulae]
MIIDHRTYNIVPRKTKEYLKLFEEIGLPVQKKHLGNLLGYYVTEIGPQDQLVHLWGYRSLADMEARRAQRNADPAWADFLVKSEGLVRSQETKIIRPVSFSPDAGQLS